MPASIKSARWQSSCPARSADVQATIAWAAEHRWPIIPRGGGTSLSGQSIGAGIVIDFSKYMNHILEIDRERQTARVEPGVVLDQLNTAAARARFAIRARRGHQQPRQRGRHDRQQLGRLALDLAWQNRRSRDRTGRRVGRWHAGRAAARTAGEWAAAVNARRRLGPMHREMRRLSAASATKSSRAIRAMLRRVSGYNLDEFVPECRERVPCRRECVAACASASGARIPMPTSIWPG